MIETFPVSTKVVSRSLISEDAKYDTFTPCASILLTSFVLMVNKYILTSLGFQFPTLFLGWQTFAMSIILKLDSVVFVSNTKTNLKKKWRQVFLYSPAIFFYLLSIYSGSKTLSKLDIHIFLPLQNYRLVLSEIMIIMTYAYDDNKRSIPKWQAGFLLLLIAAFAYSTKENHHEYDPIVYKWAALHVLALAFYDLYGVLAVEKLSCTLTSVEKVYSCNLLSFFVLAISSVLSQEIYLAQQFPHWKLYRFYLACFMSGCLGGWKNLFTFKIHNTLIDNSNLQIRQYSGLPRELNRLTAELDVLSKFIISFISFKLLCSSENDCSRVLLCLGLSSFLCEFLYHRVQSRLPSVTWLFLSSLGMIWKRKKSVFIA